MMGFAEKTFWHGAKVVDDQGTVYRVVDATASPDRNYSVILSIEKVKKPLKDYFYQAERPDFDKIAKYIFDCLVTENMVNPECKIGVVKDFINACVRAATYLDNNHHADPDAQCEATTK